MPNGITAFLAAWGALVSTVAILWNIRRDLADRGRLRVFCYVGNLVGAIPSDNFPKLVYKVVNSGRRPIVVTHIGGAFSKDKHFMIPTRIDLPKTLQPGEYFLEYSKDLSALDENPQALWAIDSTNKYWKVPRKELRSLLREHQKDRG